MDKIEFSKDTPASVSSPTAYPLPTGLKEALANFLSEYPQVRRGYLLQIVYPPNADPQVGDRPCLTCLIEIERDPDNSVFNGIIGAGQPVVEGKLGEWQFLDFLRSEAVPNADQIAPAFYVKKT